MSLTLAPRRLWTVLKAVILTTTLLNLAVFMYVSDSYYDKLPRSPDPASGRIYPDNFHGVGVYLTAQEHFRLHSLEYSFDVLVVLILLGASAHIFWRRL